MRRPAARRPPLGALIALSAALIGSACSSGGSSDTASGAANANAAITAVHGGACGYFVNVGLFGGPQQRRGCDQPTGAPPTGASPSVALPAGGSATALTASDADGAAAQYGPATIFGGRWPDDVATAPPSGPMAVSTQGTPDGGTVTSSADIGLNPKPIPVRCEPAPTPPTPPPTPGQVCTSPGGFGPFPVEGDSLHVECTASATAVTGTTKFVNATLATTTDAGGSPKDQEPVPDNPPPNYTRSGVITNVGDVFTVVYNQQVVNPDGSLTVNAVHTYLFGPTAVGEMVKGSATCGVTPSPLSTKDTLAPTCGTLVVEPMAPDDPTPKTPRTELIGVFDAGGLQSITKVQATNGKVEVGSPSGEQYLQFRPGQTGPLQVTATRIDESKPMSWSFDATDKAGNVTHCPPAGR